MIDLYMWFMFTVVLFTVLWRVLSTDEKLVPKNENLQVIIKVKHQAS